MKFKEKLQNYIYKHECLKYWLLVISRFRNPQWRKNVVHLWNSLDIVISENRGENNKNVILYDINFNKSTGFFDTVFNVLYYLCYANKFNLQPVVNVHNSFYEEQDPINGANHFWEYYFKPCSKYDVDDLKNSFTVVPFTRKDFSDLAKRWNQAESRTYKISDEAIYNLGKIYRQYVSLNDVMFKKIKYDISQILCGKYTLGVHVRRGDMLSNVDHHPIPPEISDFIDAAKKAIESKNYEQIFVASSDMEVIDSFKKVFGNKMVTYGDIVRTEGIQGVWEAKDSRQYRKYMSGVDVLRDVYTLVACNGLIACLSNLSAMAQIIKVAENSKFDYLYTVDKGINKNNKSADNLIKKQLKAIGQ